MERKELELKGAMLLNRVKNINDWIKKNPGTDPNMYEMTECLVEYASLTKSFCALINDAEMAAGNFDYLYHIVEKACLTELDHEIRTMLKCRGVMSLDTESEIKEFQDLGFSMIDAGKGNQVVSSAFFEENPDAAKFLKETHYLAITGAYPTSGFSEDEIELKKQTYARIAGVALYIWQEVRKNPEFVYNNEMEYAQMMRNYVAHMQLLENKGMVPLYDCREAIDGMLEYINNYTNLDQKELGTGVRR